jgi:hypothetical protein
MPIGAALIHPGTPAEDARRSAGLRQGVVKLIASSALQAPPLTRTAEY